MLRDVSKGAALVGMQRDVHPAIAEDLGAVATKLVSAVVSSEIVAVAVPGEALVRPELIDPELGSWEGAWLGWLLKFGAAGGKLNCTPDLSFANPTPYEPEPALLRRSDSLILARRLQELTQDECPNGKSEVLSLSSLKVKRRGKSAARASSRLVSSEKKLGLELS